MSFIERRRSKFAPRQQAVGAVVPNPPKGVSRTGGGEQQERIRIPSPPRRRSDSSAGRKDRERDQTPRDTHKRGRDTSTSKDQTPESPRDTTEPTTQRRRTEDQQIVNRDKGQEPVSRTIEVQIPSWLREGFQVPVLQTELVALRQEISNSAPPLTGLHLADPKVGRFLGTGALNRCVDTDMYKSIGSMCVNDSVGHIGAYMSQV